MYLKHHEKQVKDILSYLDELHLHRIERMEEERTNGNELKTELKRIRTQIIRLQKKRTSNIRNTSITLDAIQQLIADFTAALEAQTAAMASASNPNRNTNLTRTRVVKMGNYKECAEENKVTFATGTLTDDALSWWNAYAQPMGIEQGCSPMSCDHFAGGMAKGLSKRIVELEKDLSKSEAKSIAFEIALQHKSRENNSLKTVQKENENFMASLQLENAHLKQTYKDLFESVQRSKVETHQCDEAKVKDDFDEIETRNIELEYRVASLIKENEHLKLTYKNLFDSIKKSRVQTKTSNVTQDEAENLKSQLFEFAETKLKNILEKIEFFKKKQLDISELNKGSGENVCDNAKCELQTKIVELEKVLTQQTKDFNDIRLELSNRTAKFEAYFE
ncbi:hypothetical protein Tco_0719538 [Tanacetum coccineum]